MRRFRFENGYSVLVGASYLNEFSTNMVKDVTLRNIDIF